jgi:uncharacterized protein with GYD domain
MARYVTLIQFADQGIRNIKETVKRGDAAVAEAEKMVSAFMLKIGSLGNVKSHTMRAFRREEMEGILAKIK